jgi:hypothetical protein
MAMVCEACRKDAHQGEINHAYLLPDAKLGDAIGGTQPPVATPSFERILPSAHKEILRMRFPKYEI